MVKQRHSFQDSFLVLWPIKMMYSSPKATLVDIFRSAEEKPNEFKLNITFFLSTYPAIFYIIDLFYFRLSLLKNPNENYSGISACLPF
jgi:hypothetical protein